MSCPNNPARRGAPPRRAVQSRGFTLVELLVSIMLLAIVLVLLYGSFSQISSGTILLNARLEEQQESRLLLRMIADDLRAAQYFEQFARGEGNDSGLYVTRDFVGAREFSKLYFHANVASRFHRRVSPAADPGMHELAYWVEPSEEDRDLMVLKRREDFYLDEDMEEGGIVVTLSEGIETFRVELLAVGEQESELDDNWLEEWDSGERPATSRMPLALRLTLALRGAPESPIREEIVEINLQAALGVAQ